MISFTRRLGVLLMALGGCSFAMQGVDPARNREQEPKCTDSTLPVFLDGLIASSSASALVEVARTSETPMTGEEVVGVLAVSALFTVSALVGSHKYKQCRRAKAVWHAEQAIRESGAAVEDAPAPVHKTAWCFETDADLRCFETRQDCAAQVAASAAAAGPCTEQPAWQE